MVAAAVVGSAVVGAGASVAASSKASKTAKSTAQSNNALQQQIYDQNKQTLAPFISSGSRATTAIESLLGLAPASQGTNIDWNTYFNSSPEARAYRDYHMAQGNTLEEVGRMHWLEDGSRIDLTPYQIAPAAGSSGNAAFDAYKGSTGYTSRLQEGQNQVTAALGGRGMLESGAAQRALTRYGQTAASDEFGRYLGYLTNQQGVGLTAASAQAGVGTGYANSVSANNNNAANTSANAALSNAGAINSALGTGVSAYALSQGLKSSYGGMSNGVSNANYGLGGIY